MRKYAGTVPVSAEETSESTEEPPPFSAATAAVCLHTGATCLFCRKMPRPLGAVPTNRNMHIYIPRPQQRHETSLQLALENTKTSIKKDKKADIFCF